MSERRRIGRSAMQVRCSSSRRRSMRSSSTAVLWSVPEAEQTVVREDSGGQRTRAPSWSFHFCGQTTDAPISARVARDSETGGCFCPLQALCPSVSVPIPSLSASTSPSSSPAHFTSQVPSSSCRRGYPSTTAIRLTATSTSARLLSRLR